MGWEVDADGLHQLLLRLRRDTATFPSTSPRTAPPSTAGVVDRFVDDPQRVAYLRDHLAALERAVEDGVDVQRYYAWSLLNTSSGSTVLQSFGIIHVDYETQRPHAEAQRALVRDYIARSRERLRPADGQCVEPVDAVDRAVLGLAVERQPGGGGARKVALPAARAREVRAQAVVTRRRRSAACACARRDVERVRLAVAVAGEGAHEHHGALREGDVAVDDSPPSRSAR